MPVSLLVSDDGAALVSFVGLTGNDFLNILYRMDRRVPSLFNGTSPESRRRLPGRNAPAVPSGLTAGGGDDSLPVFHSLGERSTHLLPFGFSETRCPLRGTSCSPATPRPPSASACSSIPSICNPADARACDFSGGKGEALLKKALSLPPDPLPSPENFLSGG